MPPQLTICSRGSSGESCSWSDSSLNSTTTNTPLLVQCLNYFSQSFKHRGVNHLCSIFCSQHAYVLSSLTLL